MSQQVLKKYVETISGINVTNGNVKIFFVDHDESKQADGKDPSEMKKDEKLLMKHDHTVIMPISGFMYMVSVIKNLLDNPQMQEQIERYIEAGLLPSVDEKSN